MAPSESKKKPLDTVVKFALAVFVGSFALIWGGMYLSRPDRSIPPYTVGAQSSHLVVTDVPRGTTDEEVESLVKRFRKVGRETHDFARMKLERDVVDARPLSWIGGGHGEVLNDETGGQVIFSRGGMLRRRQCFDIRLWSQHKNK